MDTHKADPPTGLLSQICRQRPPTAPVGFVQLKGG
jgi:hypothetical protein